VILDTAAAPAGVVVTAAVDDAETEAARAAGPPAATAPSPAAPAPAAIADPELVVEVRCLMAAVQELVDAQWSAQLPGVGIDLVRLNRRLVAQGVDATIAAALVRATAGRLGHGGSLDAALAGALASAPPADDRRVQVLLGPPGDGKTTTAVKLAVRARRQGRRVALVTADTYRVGAAVELETYGRAIEVPVARAADAGELTRVLARLTEAELVLVDTAGVGPGQETALAEIAALVEAAGSGAGRLLVASAATGSQAAAQTWEAFAQLAPEACVLTKLDVASGGAVLGLCWRRGLPVSHVAAGRSVSAALEVATPDRLARCLLAA
jgi:flagellar biosynthesis protein FlhF